jgi:hypothetical protein
VDFSKPLVEEDTQDQRDLAVLRSHDQALETLILILYAYKGLSFEEIDKNPKLQLQVQLLYDVFSTMIHKVDPWFIEKILSEYAEHGLVKERLGATGETMYGVSE